MIRTHLIVLLLSAGGGAAVMFLFLRVRESRLARANRALQMMLERDRDEESLRRASMTVRQR